MKAFISIDLEGMPYVVIPGHLNLKGTLYKEARKISTKVTLIVADELKKSGFDEVLIADSHGPMVNLIVDDLPEKVSIIRGFPRPTSMVAGVGDCDVALFLGYHSKFGTRRSIFDHTYSSSTIRQLEVNGIVMSEYLLNSFTVGDFNVPTILVAGDAQLLKDDAEEYTPWVEKVILKHSLSRGAAKSSNMVKIEKDLRKAVTKAVTNYKNQEVKPLKADQPVKVTITFLSSYFADTAELLPMINRIDGLTIEFTASNMVEAYKIFEFLVIAARGTSEIRQGLG